MGRTRGEAGSNGAERRHNSASWEAARGGGGGACREWGETEGVFSQPRIVNNKSINIDKYFKYSPMLKLLRGGSAGGEKERDESQKLASASELSREGESWGGCQRVALAGDRLDLGTQTCSRCR